MTTSPSALLQVADVSYSYNEFTLDHVSVAVPRGAFVGLLGPNGCGKTTLLRLMAGVMRPQGGRVSLNGEPMERIARRRIAQHVAVVPQETHPAFDYTVIEMVLMGRHPHLGAFAIEGPEDVAIAEASLAATGTAHLAGRSYMTLSGGEKQRVIIASALAQAPNLLLLDEPTASLDLGYQIEIASLLADLNRERGATLVLATHDLNLAASLCDTLVLMRAGQVVASGPPMDVLNPETIHTVYGVRAEVVLHETARHLVVTPIARSSNLGGPISRGANPGGSRN